MMTPTAAGRRGWTEHTPRATGEIDISIAYSNPSTDRLMNLYADWAESYDSDLIDAYGYMAPADAVAAFTALGLREGRRHPRCRLRHRPGRRAAGGGRVHIRRRRRPLARNARRGGPPRRLSRPLPARHDGRLRAADRRAIGTDLAPAPPYDAVICVGVFGYGPPHVADLPRIMDAAAAGAPVLVTVNGMGWVKMGWEEALPPILDAAGIELRSRTRIRHMVSEGIEAELLELRRG